MNRCSQLLRGAATAAAVAAAVAPGTPSVAGELAGQDSPKRPNVLLYVVDTQRADTLRSYGRSGAKTPNADALGHEGTLFVNGHASSSWTRASIGSILTGLHPDVHGAQGRGDALPTGLSLLSEELAEAGYHTGAIVTNPNVGSFFGFAQGFEDFIELYQRREPGIIGGRESTTPSDEVTQHAIEWIDRAARPFLLFVLTIDPHWPYEPSVDSDLQRKANAELAVRFAKNPNALDAAERLEVRRLYEAEIEFNDASLGRLLDHLRARRIYDDTIVVYTADHGEEFWEHGGTQHGRTLYDETTHVPLIVRYPRSVAMAVRVDDPVQLVDITPTVLELAGVASSVAFDGTMLTGPRSASPRARYARLDLDGHRLRALTSHPWKLILDARTGERKLFNLDLDPEELWNMAATHPKRVRDLSKQLSALIAANEQRGAHFRTGDDSPVTDQAIPEAARKALKALGYIE